MQGDGRVIAYFGKMDMGHGLTAAVGQIVAEELDVPFYAVKVDLADTATSVNQGGASGSTGIQDGGKQMRVAAAEARRVLVEMAATKLSLPADQLAVTDGVVHAKADAAKKASYAELIGGRYFNVQLDWNKQWGNPLYAPGKAQPKPHTAHKIVGKPIKREDVAPKVFCEEDYCTDIKVPGMVHGRMIRPAIAGAVPVKVDESSIKDIPGVKVVWQKDFLGLIAENTVGEVGDIHPGEGVDGVGEKRGVLVRVVEVGRDAGDACLDKTDEVAILERQFDDLRARDERLPRRAVLRQRLLARHEDSFAHIARLQ